MSYLVLLSRGRIDMLNVASLFLQVANVFLCKGKHIVIMTIAGMDSTPEEL